MRSASGGSASVSRRSMPGCPARSMAAAAGTIVPRAEGNAASRTPPPRRAGDERPRAKKNRAPPSPPRAQPGVGRELVLGRVEPAQDLGGPVGQQPARVGEPDAAPRPLDEAGSGLGPEAGP